MKNLVKKIPGTKRLFLFLKMLKRILYNVFLECSGILGLGFEVQSKLLLKSNFQKLIWINPNSITYVAPKNTSNKFIITIDDSLIKTIEASRPTIPVTIEKMFVDKESYDKTPQFLYMMKKVHNGEKAYYCQTEADVHHYFQKLKGTYTSMKTNGYLLQEELRKTNHKLIDPRKKKNNNDELQIVISKDRFLLGGGGTHRLLIAKLLNLDKSAGIVKYVDKAWAKEVFDKNKTKNLKKVIHNELNHISFK